MPYRRLPNTDQARVRALRTALEESDRQHLQLVISYKTQHEAKVLLQKFEQAMGLYKQTYDNQVNSNKDFQQIFRNARLYISHFIQVLNLAVQRSEIKKEYKKLYHLEPEDFSVPDMVSSESLIEWGQNIIEGEAQRMRAGGVPLYNPAIAKVKVHYDIFKEYRDNQLFLQQNTARYADKVNVLRQPIDDLIVEAWNQIEGFFNELPPFKRMESCKAFGVIYYYRRGEAELTPADDLPKPIEIIEEAPVVEAICESPVEATIAEEPVIEMEVAAVTEEQIILAEELTPVIDVAIEVESVIESTVEADPVQMAEEEAPVVMEAENILSVETEIQPVVSVEQSVEIILETIEEPQAVTEESPLLFEPEMPEVTLFDNKEMVAEVAETEPELKLNGAIPKKRKKRNAKQDELLSLFFQ
jgi:hypothetical protein